MSHSPTPGLATSYSHTANDVSLEYMIRSLGLGCWMKQLTILKVPNHKTATFA